MRALTYFIALFAVALGVGLTHWALSRARATESRARSERVAVVSLNALVEIVERAGVTGDNVRRAVAAVAALPVMPRRQRRLQPRRARATVTT